VPGDILFAGELDLTTRIRPPAGDYLGNLAAVLLGPEVGNIRRVFVAKGAALRLKRLQAERDRPRVGDVVDVRAVANLEDVLRELWPELMSSTKEKQAISANSAA
jgi:hypothetical protein